LQLQVLNIVVYKALNDLVQARCSNWLLAGNLALNPTGNTKNHEWVMVAWNSISSEPTVQGLKKCHTSSRVPHLYFPWEIESELPKGEPPKGCLGANEGRVQQIEL
jgi:hypothetical protein